MLNRVTFLVGTAVLAFTAPAHAQTVAAARESLRAADASVSATVQAAGLADGLLPNLVDSADVLAPGAALLRGREGARRGLSGTPFAGSRMTWTPIRVDVSADGRSGYTYGGGTMTAADGASTPARYIAFWRGGAGAWRIEAFMFNAGGEPVTPPPAGFFPADDQPLSVAPGVDPDSVLDDAALAAIMQADRDFAALAMAQNPGAAFQAFAAPDAALLGGAYGPEAIGALFAGGWGTLEWGPVAGGMAQSADLGYTVGTAVRRGADGRVGYTKYLTVWRLQPNGEWRWVVDGGNPYPGPHPSR